VPHRLAGLLVVLVLLPAGAARASVGQLTQLGGLDRCVSESTTGGFCRDAQGIGQPTAAAVSPDGRSVYVAGPATNSVATFVRDPASGALTQSGCVSDDGSGGACVDGRGLGGAADIAVSADGKSVYVASTGTGAVAVFDRDTTTGSLTQKAGTAGCASETGDAGACADGVELATAQGVAVSPDGKSVYVASWTSDAIAVFDRDTTSGVLTQDGCVNEDASGGCSPGQALDDPVDIKVSGDDENVYVASDASNAVAVFDRDKATGTLTQQADTDGCISNDGSSGACADGRQLVFPRSLALTADGRSVYVASHIPGAVVVLDRDLVTGSLTQKAGPAGCFTNSGSGGTCGDGTAIGNANFVAASSDGSSVYLASGFDGGAVAVFDRAPDGVLTQKAGAAGCVTDAGTPPCADGFAVGDPRAIGISPDGASVYVADAQNAAVSVFARETADGAEPDPEPVSQQPGAPAPPPPGQEPPPPLPPPLPPPPPGSTPQQPVPVRIRTSGNGTLSVTVTPTGPGQLTIVASATPGRAGRPRRTADRRARVAPRDEGRPHHDQGEAEPRRAPDPAPPAAAQGAAARDLHAGRRHAGPQRSRRHVPPAALSAPLLGFPAACRRPRS
jgi:DNA-binding beta-propeller fold protein YncE